MKRRTLAVLLLAAALTGCGERTEPLGPLAQTYPVTVRGAGDDATVVPRKPNRIAALGAGPAQLLDALGAGAQIAGGVRRSGPVDIQAIVALRPDLVVATEENDPLELDRLNRVARAPVYVEPTSSILDVERAAVDLGFLTGRPVAARQLVARMRAGVAHVQAQVATRPATTVFVDTGFFTTVPTRSLLGSLVRLAGGRSVAGERPGSEPVSPRRIARLNPDVYLVTSASGVTLRSLRRDPEAGRIAAVRRGRVVVVSSRLVEVPGPHIAAGLAAVARALHPDAF